MTYSVLYGIMVGFLCVFGSYIVITIIACLSKIFQLPYHVYVERNVKLTKTSEKVAPPPNLKG